MDHAFVTRVLAPHIQPRRIEALERVLAARTDRAAVVCEGIHKTHNYSAIMRTLDAFGVMDIHLVGCTAGPEPEVVGTATQGAHKWLAIHRHDDVAGCFSELRSRGYRVACAALTEDAVDLRSIDMAVPTAFVFGNELEGASPAALARADYRFSIPMWGFSQSFNVSVAAAITLAWWAFTAPDRGCLDDGRRAGIRADWYRRSVRHSDAILADVLMKQKER